MTQGASEGAISEELFVASANMAPVPVWVSNRDGLRIFFNTAWLTFTGARLGAVRGARWLELVHPDDRDACVEAHRAAAATRESFQVEYRLRDRLGRWRWMLDWGVPRSAGHEAFAGYLGSCVDVTEQTEARVRLERRERQQASAADLGRRALEGLPVAEVLEEGARRALEGTGASLVAVVGVTDDEELSFELLASVTDGSDVSVRRDVDQSFARRVVESDRHVVVADWEQEPDDQLRARAAAAGVRSSAAAIVRRTPRAFGLYIASSPEPDAFGDDDVQFLRTIANVVAAAVARAEIEHDLRANEAAARLALDVGRIGAWRWRPDSGEVFWSPELEALVGLEPGGFGGSLDALLDFVHPDERVAAAASIERAAALGGELRFEFRVVRTDGTTAWLYAIGRVLPGHEGTDDEEWIGVASDVTARKEADVEREELLAREQDANRQLGETVARLDTLLARAPVGFGFLDPDLRVLRANELLAAVSTRAPDDILGRPVREVLPGWWSQLEPALREVAEQATPVVDVEIHDLAPSDPPVARDSLVSISPVLDASSALLGFGLVVVDITARAHRARAARIIGAAAELVASSPDLDRVVDVAARVAVPELADLCHVLVVGNDREPDRVGVAHVDPELERLLTSPVADAAFTPSSHPAVLAAIEHGGPLLLRRVRDERLGDLARSDDELDLLRRLGAVSCILAPLRVADRVIGVMSFAYTERSGRHYHERDLGPVVEIARRVALAVENAGLARLAERATERLDLLARTSELLTLELDSEVRLAALARVVLPNFADICAVYVQTDPDRARLAALASLDEAIERQLRSVDEWPTVALDSQVAAAIAIRENRPVVVPEVGDDEVAELGLGADDASSVRELGVRSLLTVPLRGSEGPIGAMAFGYVGSGRRYRADDVPLALELAGRTGPTLDNALRYEQEQATATALQRTLLPERLPGVDGLALAARYLPGSEGLKVGGDWYDVVTLPDGAVALAIGDVVGHGVRAAATMGRFRTALELCLLDGADSAAETIERVNRFVGIAHESEMATLLVMLLRPDTGVLRYASAGHLPALVCSVDGSTRWLDDTKGVPLGASETALVTEAEAILAPGDLLVLCTDGLVERRTESLDVGFARLERAVVAAAGDRTSSPDEIADALVDSMLGDRTRADDVALLVVEVEARRPEVIDLSASADPKELAGIRARLREWLASSGVDGETAGEIVVAVNEIGANAVEHAYGAGTETFDLRASISGGVVEVTVVDRGRWRPQRFDDQRGRGLELARAFMDSVRIDTTESGTVVRLTRAATPR